MKIFRSALKSSPIKKFSFFLPFFCRRNRKQSKGEGLDAKGEQTPEGSDARAKVIRQRSTVIRSTFHFRLTPDESRHYIFSLALSKESSRGRQAALELFRVLYYCIFP